MIDQFYVASCPVCEQGLVRARVCEIDDDYHPCVVCDQCDATWTNPTLTRRFRQSNPEAPVFPGSSAELWEAPARWANAEDLCLLGWPSLPLNQRRDTPVEEKLDG